MKQILVVEDDPGICDVLTFLLVDEGYQVVCKTSAEEALICVGKQPFDLVTLDMHLPDMTGNDFLKMLTWHDPQVPVVIISANTSLFKAHPQVKGVVNKPFDLDVVAETVRTCLA